MISEKCEKKAYGMFALLALRAGAVNPTPKWAVKAWRQRSLFIGMDGDVELVALARNVMLSRASPKRRHLIQCQWDAWLVERSRVMANQIGEAASRPRRGTITVNGNPIEALSMDFDGL